MREGQIMSKMEHFHNFNDTLATWDQRFHSQVPKTSVNHDGDERMTEMRPKNLIPTNTGELGMGGHTNICWQNFAQ